MQSHQGERLPFSLSADMTRGLIRLGRGQGATLFMVLLAAMKALLVRYTGQADVIVGTPVAGRVRPEIESLIGLFLNTLVLRTDASGDPSFLELLKRVRETAVGAYGNQDVPVERLVEVLRPERDPSRNPLFQVMFGLQNPAPPLEMPGLGMRRLDVDRGASHTDLALSVLDLGAACGTLGIQHGSIRPHHHRPHGDALRAAAGWDLAEPDRPISRLPLLTDGERGCRPRPAGATQADLREIPAAGPGRLNPRALRAWVDRAPDRIAVKTLRHEWTYDELHRRSAAVARRLHESGAAGGRVGLLFDQDAPMISALMGALMSGTAYVPLDPLYPRGRLTFMLQDSGARVLLTGREHLSLGRELGGDSITLIELDEKSDASAHGEIPSPPPDGLAYILYTSGSTGEPKGVMQNQRNVLHHIRAYTNNLQIQPDDRLTLLSSYSFDAAVMDIFGALLNGATLCPLDVRQAGLDRLRGWLLAQGSRSTIPRPRCSARCGGLVPGRRSRGPAGRSRGEDASGDVEMYRRHFDADCTLVNGLGPTSRHSPCSSSSRMLRHCRVPQFLSDTPWRTRTSGYSRPRGSARRSAARSGSEAHTWPWATGRGPS
jgi:non-ribosomal peptide synthetase component F